MTGKSICGNRHDESGDPDYDHVCQFEPGHGPVEVLDPSEVAQHGMRNVERGVFMQHGDPEAGAWWSHPDPGADADIDPNPKGEDPAAVLAERDELREKVAYLRAGILELEPAQIIERITAIGAAEWSAGSWLADKIAAERADARRLALAEAAAQDATAGAGQGGTNAPAAPSGTVSTTDPDTK